MKNDSKKKYMPPKKLKMSRFRIWGAFGEDKIILI